MPTPTRYGDLADPIPAMAFDLSRGRLSPDTPCHLDPDIDADALKCGRQPGWRGALGQVGAALSHLQNTHVGPGDLFLFWGLFRSCERTATGWQYTGPRRHGIFGWLEVDAIVEPGLDGAKALARFPWLDRHPHARPGWSYRNSIYVAKEFLSVGGGTTRGSGVFDRLIPLSATGSVMPSMWDVPAWLDPTVCGVGMTFHPTQRWLGNGMLKAAARGQEFVSDINERADARSWLESLFGR
jgi:hypothetical protein